MPSLPFAAFFTCLSLPFHRLSLTSCRHSHRHQRSRQSSDRIIQTAGCLHVFVLPKEASAGVRADCEARALSERAAYKLAKESHVPSAEYAKAAKFVAAMKEQLKESNPARKKRAKVRKNQLLTRESSL